MNLHNVFLLTIKNYNRTQGLINFLYAKCDYPADIICHTFSLMYIINQIA